MKLMRDDDRKSIFSQLWHEGHSALKSSVLHMLHMLHVAMKHQNDEKTIKTQ